MYVLATHSIILTYCLTNVGIQPEYYMKVVEEKKMEMKNMMEEGNLRYPGNEVMKNWLYVAEAMFCTTEFTRIREAFVSGIPVVVNRKETEFSAGDSHVKTTGYVTPDKKDNKRKTPIVIDSDTPWTPRFSAEVDDLYESTMRKCLEFSNEPTKKYLVKGDIASMQKTFEKNIVEVSGNTTDMEGDREKRDFAEAGKSYILSRSDSEIKGGSDNSSGKNMDEVFRSCSMKSMMNEDGYDSFKKGSKDLVSNSGKNVEGGPTSSTMKPRGW